MVYKYVMDKPNGKINGMLEWNQLVSGGLQFEPCLWMFIHNCHGRYQYSDDVQNVYNICRKSSQVMTQEKEYRFLVTTKICL